ncbi:venom protein 302-like [Centruroides vittatus]|uniref:venom protein 302-like n=1 Tax=Centruroides vittatus TaxID=120091 RepID=UPI00350F61AA
MKKFFFILCLCFSIFIDISALDCRECQRDQCDDKTEEECPAGLVTDLCDCCLVCGKGKNEDCGGDFEVLGKCGTGLYCKRENDEDVYSNGVCKKIK